VRADKVLGSRPWGKREKGPPISPRGGPPARAKLQGRRTRPAFDYGKKKEGDPELPVSRQRWKVKGKAGRVDRTVLGEKEKNTTAVSDLKAQMDAEKEREDLSMNPRKRKRGRLSRSDVALAPSSPLKKKSEGGGAGESPSTSWGSAKGEGGRASRAHSCSLCKDKGRPGGL